MTIHNEHYFREVCPDFLHKLVLTACHIQTERCRQPESEKSGEFLRHKYVISYGKPYVFTPLCSLMVRPYLEYCVGPSLLKEDLTCSEAFQQLADEFMAMERQIVHVMETLGLKSMSLEVTSVHQDI